MTGTLYFPTQPVQFTSSTAITLNGGIVAYTVTANSSGTLTLTGKATDAASYALRHVAFVE
jgi:hypothetical protein